MSSFPPFRFALLACLALGLATAARAADPMPTGTGNAAHDMLARFSPVERNRTLDRLLRSVDRSDCDVIESTFIEYRSGQFAAWRAACSDGRRFLLELIDGSEPTVAVLECSGNAETKARCGF